MTSIIVLKLKMDATEWNYIGEGGKHALFSHQSNNDHHSINNNNNNNNNTTTNNKKAIKTSSNSNHMKTRTTIAQQQLMNHHHHHHQWKGCILRIQKKDLVQASEDVILAKSYDDNQPVVNPTLLLLSSSSERQQQQQQQQPSTSWLCHNVGKESAEMGSMVAYIQNIIFPILSETYFDVPQIISLDSIFLNQLRNQTIHNNNTNTTTKTKMMRMMKKKKNNTTTYTTNTSIAPPPSRRKDWEIQQQQQQTTVSMVPTTTTTTTSTATATARETKPTTRNPQQQENQDQPPLPTTTTTTTSFFGMLLLDYKKWTWKRRRNMKLPSQSSHFSNSSSTTTIIITETNSSSSSSNNIDEDDHNDDDDHDNNNDNNNDQIISIEIKPKAGYKAFSPLVNPMHRSKYQNTRFYLLQQLYQKGYIQKGWIKNRQHHQQQQQQETTKDYHNKSHDEDNHIPRKDSTNKTTTTTTTTDNTPTTNTTATPMNERQFQISHYDPLDLFSTDPIRIQTALVHLFSCPQNNLRVWYGDTQWVGLGASTVDAKQEEEDEDDSSLLSGDENRYTMPSILDNMFFSTTVSNEGNRPSTQEYSSRSRSSSNKCHTPNRDKFLIEILPEIISTILSKEDLLPRLLQLQRLDILDADGAILVYHRLVSLYHGSHEAAERALDDYSNYYYDSSLMAGSTSNSSNVPPSTMASDDEPSPQVLLSSSPFSNRRKLDRNKGVVRTLCQKIETFRQWLEEEEQKQQKQKQLLFPEEEMDRIRNECLCLIESLSAQDCIYLLQNWLLSLAMCDVSLFVTLRFCTEEEEGDEEVVDSVPARTTGGKDSSSSTPGSNSGSGSSRTTIVQTTNGKTPGCLIWQNGLGRSKTAVHYTLKVIDCDCKPAKKLRSRSDKEIPFRYLQTK